MEHLRAVARRFLCRDPSRSSVRSRSWPVRRSTKRSGKSFAAMLGDAAPALAYAAGILLFVCAAVLRWLFAAIRRPRAACRPDARSARGEPRAPGGRRRRARDGASSPRAINRLADAYRGHGRELEARSAESSARLEEERNRLAALMSELSEGVLVCNAEGRILLYNERRARSSLGRAESGARAATTAPLGLGRSVFALPRPRPGRARARQGPAAARPRKATRPHTLLRHQRGAAT